MLKLGIFTKPVHVEKIVNYLNQHTNIDYIISTDKRELYDCYTFDIGISYAFSDKINIPRTCTSSWYNYHPAPLPRYKGNGVYSRAIKECVFTWAVSLHHMTMIIDEGELIDKIEFELVTNPTSTNEIGSISHYYLFQLFKKTIESFVEPVVFGTCDTL